MKNSLQNRVISNSVWMMFNKIYSMIISLVVGAISARYLGPSNYGLLNYGTSLISFFLIISSLGFSSTLVVEMVQKPERRGSFLGSALVMRFMASCLSFVGIIILVVLIEPHNKQLQIVTILQAIAVILNTYEIFLYWFQLKMQMKIVTIASVIGLTVTAIWRVLLLVQGASVEFFALTNSISAFICGLCVLFFFVRSVHPKLQISIADSRYLISNSYHFIIAGLAVTLYSQLDRIMLGKILNTEIVGYYSAAMTIAIMWEFIPQALINSARPILAEIRIKSEKDFIKKYQILLLGITMLGLIVSGGMTLLGKIVILILYGAEYAPAEIPLMILIWSTSFAMLGTARIIWLVTESANKYEKYFTIMGAVTNIILNTILIPTYGINGAAIATLISQILVALAFPSFFSETRKFVFIYFGCFKQISALKKLCFSFCGSMLSVLKKRVMR